MSLKTRAENKGEATILWVETMNTASHFLEFLFLIPELLPFRKLYQDG